MTVVAGDSRLARMSLNQRTIRQWTLADCVDGCLRAGVPAIGVWREPLAELGLNVSGLLLRSSGLRVSSLCRGGFFTAPKGAAAEIARDDNRRAVDEAAEIGAACLTLVVGGLPPGSRDLAGARERVSAALTELAGYAERSGVQLALEPMHPVFAADRSVLSGLGQALDIALVAAAHVVGVTVDAYHVWWDPRLQQDLTRSAGRVVSYQISDWVTPIPADLLNGRGLMGDGHIDLPTLTAAVDRTGYRGDIEVEIFSSALWESDPRAVLETLKERYVAALPAAADSAGVRT